MNELHVFLRQTEEQPTGPSQVEDLRSWDQLINGTGRMNGRDFSRLARYDLPRAMAFLVGFATSFPKDRRPQNPEELLDLVNWEKPEDLQSFVDAIGAQQNTQQNNLQIKK